MSRARSKIRFVLVTAAVAALGLAALAPPAAAQARRSIVERYQTWEEFEARRFSFLSEADIRVVDIETCVENGQARWVAVYNYMPNSLSSAGFDEVFRARTLPELNGEIDRRVAQGWRVDDIDASLTRSYQDDSGGGGFSITREEYAFSALMNPGAGAQAVLSESSFVALLAVATARNGEGLRLVDLDIVTVQGQRRYHGVMRAGTHEEQLFRANNWAAFDAQRNLLFGQGWRLRDIAVAEGEYVGLFNRGNGPHAAEVFNDWPSLLSRWTQLDNNGRGRVRVVDVECWSEGGATRYAAVWRGDRRVRAEANPNVGPVANPPTTQRPVAPPVDRSGGN
jgi:hypothetical protein